MRSRPRTLPGLALAASLALVTAACGSNSADTATTPSTAADGAAVDSAPGQDSKAVGFIFVGPKDDFGYNQAAFQGSEAVAKAFPDLEVLRAENVPETDDAVRVMEGMIDKGAKIIFATSYGHLDPDINAFELGAQSVNPAAQTYVVNTSNWCDPAKQAAAAKSLLDQDVDVITQHQDCTGTITKAAEAAGKMVVGYHADASSLAPKGWIAGSEWSWEAMYTDIVKTALAGDFTGSKYNANFREGLKDGQNPFVESKLGSSVGADVKSLLDTAKTRISTTGSPFAGPIVTQDGKTLVAEGSVPDYATIESIMTVFVKGVVGELPKN